MRIQTALALFLVVFSRAFPAVAQEEESALHVNGHLKLQTGVFVPLSSDSFQARKNEAFIKRSSGHWSLDQPCDPVERPSVPCTPKSHGMEAGSLSMFRATLQLEGDWTPHESISVHAIFRGVRSLMLDADGFAQMPEPPMDPAEWNNLDIL